MTDDLTTAGVAPQGPNQTETKSGNNFVSLDPEKGAAQGAARPVNSFDTTAERVKNGGDSLHVAPQPVIDEAALAEVIGKVTDLWDEPLDEVHDIPQIARAVAAWLKGGARA